MVCSASDAQHHVYARNSPVPHSNVRLCTTGIYDGASIGSPICIMVPNKDQKSKDYTEMSVAYRPSHADATYDMKYGIRAVAGGGRSSARETIGRVAAGAIAKKLLRLVGGVEVGFFTAAVPNGGTLSVVSAAEQPTNTNANLAADLCVPISVSPTSCTQTPVLLTASTLQSSHRVHLSPNQQNAVCRCWHM